jgi:hypothetical protein
MVRSRSLPRGKATIGPIWLRFGIALATAGLITASVIGHAQVVNQPDQASQAGAEAARAQLYSNPEIFAQFSGAKQSVVELKTGTRHIERGVAYSGAEITDERMAATENELAPLANVLVNNPSADTTAQDTQSETALVLGSGHNVIGSFNDSGSHVGSASKFTGFSQSTNSGISFLDKGTLPTNPDGDAGDPVLARSLKTGTIFLSTLSFNTSEKLMIFRSTNNGATFLPPVNGAPGFTAATGEQDKEWIAVDNFPGAGFGNVYMFWRNFAANGGMTFTRSLNDGQTWGPNAGLKLTNGTGQGAFVAVGRDHAVYAFWFDQSASPRQIRMRKSVNQGVSFGAPVTVTPITATGSNGDLGLSPGFRTNCFPQAATNPLNAQILYVVYNDKAGADHGNIFLRISTNGGTTWGPPKKLNDDVTTHDQWQPAIAITPDGKRLCVTFYDRRLDPANNLIDHFGVIGKISGPNVSFGTNFRITNVSFPPVKGVDPVINPLYMGDYDQMAADNSFFYTTWGDNRDNSTGHSGKNANVRFARIPVVGPSAGEVAGGEGEERDEIPVSDLPAFVREALDRAVADSPPGVLAGAVTWERAFRLGDTIAIYQVLGHDGGGQAVEAEAKGKFVREIEVRTTPDKAPAAVAEALRRAMPDLEPRQVEIIIAAGKVVAYGFEQGRETGEAAEAPIAAFAAGADRGRAEVYLTPEGQVLSRYRPGESGGPP